MYLLLVALADYVTHSKQQPMEGAPHPLSVQNALERNEIVAYMGIGNAGLRLIRVACVLSNQMKLTGDPRGKTGGIERP